MNLEHVDKETLKSVVTEVLLENPNFFKSILTEILQENLVIEPQDGKDRVAKLKAMIQEDFDRYDEVFKSLA